MVFLRLLTSRVLPKRQVNLAWGLDKTYEVEVLFGIKTDTGDLFGVPVMNKLPGAQGHTTGEGIKSSSNYSKVSEVLDSFVGKQQFPYPIYSSRTVDGKPLFQWAIEGRISEIEIPKTDVEIYSIKVIGGVSEAAPFSEIPGSQILEKVSKALEEVKGDFRYEEMRKAWADALTHKSDESFYILKIECSCSSGTYMRALAEEIGKKLGVPALAYSIKRTKIAGIGLDAIAA